MNFRSFLFLVLLIALAVILVSTGSHIFKRASENSQCERLRQDLRKVSDYAQ